MKNSRALVGLALVVLGACGGGGRSSGMSGAQVGAAKAVIAQAKAGGIELDESCVNGVAGKLSESDAAKIASAGSDDAADLSPEGEALGVELLGCADEDALLELFVSGMNESGQSFDEACLRENLADFDVTQIAAASQGGDPSAELVAAMMACLDTNG